MLLPSPICSLSWLKFLCLAMNKSPLLLQAPFILKDSGFTPLLQASSLQSTLKKQQQNHSAVCQSIVKL